MLRSDRSGGQISLRATFLTSLSSPACVFVGLGLTAKARVVRHLQLSPDILGKVLHLHSHPHQRHSARRLSVRDLAPSPSTTHDHSDFPELALLLSETIHSNILTDRVLTSPSHLP